MPLISPLMLVPLTRNSAIADKLCYTFVIGLPHAHVCHHAKIGRTTSEGIA